MEQLANSIQSISFEQLAQKIITVDDSMRGVAVKTINQATTLRNWIIGCYIVETNKMAATGPSTGTIC